MERRKRRYLLLPKVSQNEMLTQPQLPQVLPGICEAGLDKLREAGTRHESMDLVGISPQENIPAELLAKIFLYSLDRKPVHVPPPSFKSSLQNHPDPAVSSTPWIIGRVCSRWRDISIAEHKLWDQIHLSSYNVAQTAIYEVISRSGTLPITLEIRLIIPNPNILVPILAHRERIRSLILTVNSKNTHHIAQVPLFINLESFKIIYHAIPDDHVIPQMFPPPILRRLNLRAHESEDLYLRNIGIHPTSFSWEQLNHLLISSTIYITPEMMLSILRRCFQLETCDVCFGSDPEEELLEDPTQYDCFVIPRLQSLRINGRHTFIGPFFEALTTPQPESFHSQPCILARGSSVSIF